MSEPEAPAGPSTPQSEPAPGRPPSWWHKDRSYWTAVTTLIAAVGLISGIVFAVLTFNKTAGTGLATNVPDSIPNRTNSPGLAVATSWPVLKGCDAATSVALPTGLGGSGSLATTGDVRTEFIRRGGGAWEIGHLYLDLSSTDGTPIEIFDIKPHIDRFDLAPPALIYSPQGGCGTGNRTRVFSFDLDKSNFAEGGIIGGGARTDPDAVAFPLGPDFILKNADHGQIRIDSYACAGNYQWSIEVVYGFAGSDHLATKVVGPFSTFSIASNTSYSTGVQNPSGGPPDAGETKISGGTRQCNPRKAGLIAESAPR